MDYSQGQSPMVQQQPRGPPQQRMMGRPGPPQATPAGMNPQQHAQYMQMRKTQQGYPGAGYGQMPQGPGPGPGMNQAQAAQYMNYGGGDQLHYAHNAHSHGQGQIPPNQMRYAQQQQPQYQEMDAYGSGMGNVLNLGGGEMDPNAGYLVNHGGQHLQQPPGYLDGPAEPHMLMGSNQTPHMSPSKSYMNPTAAGAGQLQAQMQNGGMTPHLQQVPGGARGANAYQYNIGYSTNFAVSFVGCPHWDAHKRAVPNWDESVRTIVQYGLALQQNRNKQPSFPFPNCSACYTSSNRIECCLHCVFVGCSSSNPKNSHILHHIQQKRHSHHYFSMDISRFTLYCAHCQDYIHDRELDGLVKEEKITAREVQIQALAPNPSRARCRDWKPLDMEINLINDNSRAVSSYGLRGLYNLGSTCFMNSILQSLVHNPMVRSYFLSDQHNRKDCPRLRNSPSACLCCDLDLLISKSFSGESEPFSPHQLLYSMWTYSQELAGYEQQDAHEFFISLLNGIHQHADGTPTDCQCVMHQTFQGQLKSDVTCLKCSHVSTTVDPFVDISLDLSEANTSSHNDLESMLGGEAPKPKLGDCLKRFTSAEKLDNQDFRCEKCGALGSIKQFSLKLTPCVLSIHLKRFEHSQTATKIDTFVEFPTKLDLSPYLSAPVNSEMDFLMEQTKTKTNINHEYDLFAVVNHVGTLETGHYVSFVKSKGEWFRIDDSMITRSSTQEVLGCKAYMLYYMKSRLDYQDLSALAQA